MLTITKRIFLRLLTFTFYLLFTFAKHLFMYSAFLYFRIPSLYVNVFAVWRYKFKRDRKTAKIHHS